MRKDAQDDRTVIRPHQLTMEQRNHVQITGVEDVDSFNEDMIVLTTSVGTMTLVGVGLHISELNLDSGVLTIDGQIMALEYDDRIKARRGSMFGRLFK